MEHGASNSEGLVRIKELAANVVHEPKLT